MLPEERNVQIPFLEVVSRVPAGVDFYEACRRVEGYYPKITDDDRKTVTATGVPWWLNRLQWVRKHLLLAGELMRGDGDILFCTQAGASRLQRERPRWAPKYSKAAKPRGVVVPVKLDTEPLADALGPELARPSRAAVAREVLECKCQIEALAAKLSVLAGRLAVPGEKEEATVSGSCSPDKKRGN